MSNKQSRRSFAVPSRAVPPTGAAVDSALVHTPYYAVTNPVTRYLTCATKLHVPFKRGTERPLPLEIVCLDSVVGPKRETMMGSVALGRE